jgi:hypothetical protein
MVKATEPLSRHNILMFRSDMTEMNRRFGDRRSLIIRTLLRRWLRDHPDTEPIDIDLEGTAE